MTKEHTPFREALERAYNSGCFDGDAHHFAAELPNKTVDRIIQDFPAENAALELLEALREISKGEGAYSRDHLTHADNCIDSMKAIAVDAIAKATKRD